MIAVGDTIPDAIFKSVPWTPELEQGIVCGVAGTVSTDEWKGKKILIISVPGAFTPTCHVNHLPPYLEKYDEFKAKGVDAIYVIAANDHWVMSGWGKSQGFKDKIVTLSDPFATWNAKMGLAVDLTAPGLGIRSTRYALVLDDLKVVSLEVDPKGLAKSDAVTTLSKLSSRL